MGKRVASANEGGPIAVLIAGPNGAGKSTSAPKLLKGALGVVEFLNADLIARGISPFDPEGAALAASDVMVRRMESLAAAKVSFGLETTLAARTLASRLRSLLSAGYEFHLVFLYLRSAELAVGRVSDRVQLGGHNVPELTIRHRYRSGLKNFFALYQPIATSWQMFDNSMAEGLTLIAAGRQSHTTRVSQKKLWRQINQEFGS